MKITGIIAEYNPFHKGHAHQIELLRRGGSTHIVSVMSGNFLQRGTPAICSKHLRAKMALMGGCDLVIELPLPLACAPAFRFARGGVALLEGMGCVDELSFGSECGDIEKLKELVKILCSKEVEDLTAEILSEGGTYAMARQRAVERAHGTEFATILSTPNNSLGVEYMRALAECGSGIKPTTIARVGVAHDSPQPGGGYASASLIREMVARDELDRAAMWTPNSTADILKQAVQEGRAPADISFVDRAVLSKLRSMKVEDFAALPDISEGLENRLMRAAADACSYEEFLSLAKTKRYTHARLRRIVMMAFLGLDENLCKKAPPYLHVLGFNQRGREIMSEVCRGGSMPMSHSLARLLVMGGDAEAFVRAEVRGGDLYRLMLPSVAPCGGDYRESVVILGKNTKGNMMQ